MLCVRCDPFTYIRQNSDVTLAHCVTPNLEYYQKIVEIVELRFLENFNNLLQKFDKKKNLHRSMENIFTLQFDKRKINSDFPMTHTPLYIITE